MTNTLKGPARAEKRAARLEWLRTSGLLEWLPGADDDVTEAKRDALRQALHGMTAAGLYSRTSEEQGIKWSIRLLVSALRGETVGKRSRYVRW